MGEVFALLEERPCVWECFDGDELVLVFCAGMCLLSIILPVRIEYAWAHWRSDVQRTGLLFCYCVTCRLCKKLVETIPGHCRSRVLSLQRHSISRRTLGTSIDWLVTWRSAVLIAPPQRSEGFSNFAAAFQEHNCDEG